MKKIVQKAVFVIRKRNLSKLGGALRNVYYTALGMNIGKGTFLPSIYTTWPHKVSIGIKCAIEGEVIFKYDGIWSAGKAIIIGDNTFIGHGCEFNITKQIAIGQDCLIASGCRFIDHDHGIDTTQLMRIQKSVDKAIEIGNNVWIGCNVVVLKGVSIGDNSIIGAGAVVTKPIPPNEIWGGVPAKKIGERRQLQFQSS